jgi:hypothetical protein
MSFGVELLAFERKPWSMTLIRLVSATADGGACPVRRRLMKIGPGRDM